MLYKVNINRNPKLNSMFKRLFVSAGDKKKYLQVLTRILVNLIRDHIQRNQYRFNKTRKKLGVSLVHQNYVPRNVIQEHSSYPNCHIDLRIKGIERNFRPLVILPKKTKYLTIPTSKVSFGKSARQFNDLFKPKGKNVLARNRNGKLEILYALARQVYQPMTKGMLPDERQLLSKGYQRLLAYIQEGKYKEY